MLHDLRLPDQPRRFALEELWWHPTLALPLNDLGVVTDTLAAWRVRRYWDSTGAYASPVQ